MSAPRPNPPRAAFFAVWRWPWWAWCLIAPVIYMLSAVPMSVVLESATGNNPTAESWFRVVYFPVFWAYETFPPVNNFINWYYRLLKSWCR